MIMKKIWKTGCLLLAAAMLLLMFVGCEKKPGLYAWYGGRMNVDKVLRITVDGGDGEKVYDVSFDLYRTVFLYLKDIVSPTIKDADGNAAFATKAEQTKAVKEVAEDTLIQYYSLVALCEKYGISITEQDKQRYEEDYMKKLQAYVDRIDEENFDFKGTKEEYAAELHRKTLALAGMPPEYFEFSYYRALLEQRLKMVLAEDLDDYLNQTYFHYKQVVVLYTKGDSAAEQQARAAINAAHEKLAAGEDIDAVIKEYASSDYTSEIYFDSYGNIVGSATNDTVNVVTLNAIKALETDGVSGIMSGDENDRTGYFAVFKRLGFDKNFVCGDDARARVMYECAYVGSSYTTPHYSRYLLITESYRQNTACVPTDDKVYRRIAVNTLY